MRAIATAAADRRRARGPRRLSAALLALGLLGAPAVSAAGEARAVVVGIDDYLDPDGILSDLEGAVNDAHDLADAFRAVGVHDLTVLLDDEARRKAIVDAWEGALARSNPGDRLYLTYAGHGMQRIAADLTAEADAMDEFLPLHGFARTGPGRKDFILDDEIAAFVRKAGERDVTVVLVVDACHSGTTFRSVDPRIKPRYRFSAVKVEGGLMDGLDDDELFEGLDESSDEPGAQAGDGPPANLASFAAVIDGHLVPEIMLPNGDGDAQPRGAMSYFFARGLRGAADSDADGKLSFAELRDYLLWNIKVETRGQQIPQIVTGAERQDRVLHAFPRAQSVVGPRPTRPVQLAVLNGPADGLGNLKGVQIADSPRDADIVWDARTREVLSAIDTVVAQNIGLDALRGVTEKVRARMRLTGLGERRRLPLAALPEKDIYQAGELVTLEVAAPGHPYLTLVNISNDGTVQLIYPLNAAEAEARDPQAPFRLRDVRVSGPFGADLLVALSTESAVGPLVSDLRAVDGTVAPLAVAASLSKWLQGVRYRLGLLSFYTCNGSTAPC